MISHQDKCIFVHVPKCAGQSVETFFLDRLGLSWEDRAVLLLRPNDRPNLGPPRLAHLLAQDYVRRGWISAELFRRYYKFAIVRNPWSRAVSLYRFLGQDKRTSFSSFVNRQLTSGVREQHWFLRQQWDYVVDENGIIQMDFIARMERLAEDFTTVALALGIKNASLKKVNESKAARPSFLRNPFIKSHDSWRDYYNSNLVSKVQKLYERDVDHFKYAFD